MSSNTVNRLLQAATILLIIYALVLFGQSRQTTSGPAVPAAVTGIKSGADRLVIKTDTDTIKIDREGSKWFSGKKPLTAVKAEQLLSAVENVEFTRVVSETGEDGAKYQVGDGAKSISVFQGQKELRSVTVGGSAAPGRFYAKTGGKPTIFEAEGELATLLDEPITQWLQTEPKPKKK